MRDFFHAQFLKSLLLNRNQTSKKPKEFAGNERVEKKDCKNEVPKTPMPNFKKFFDDIYTEEMSEHFNEIKNDATKTFYELLQC